MAPRMWMPWLRAASHTGAKRSIDSAIEQLMFFWLNASLAAANTTISSAFAASAPSKPFMFGTSTEYATPARRPMRSITCAPSAICGTHFGDTKLVTSMLGKPAAVRRSTSSTFTAAGIICFSFCSPSRGPTSTM